MSAVALAGCSKQGEEVVEGKEGQAVSVAGVDYTVQIARQLSTYDTEDKAYLRGLPTPQPTQMYLGVFLRVVNESDRTATPAGTLPIRDTDGRIFRQASSTGPFSYEAVPLEPDGMIPPSDGVADQSGARGAVLVYLVPRDILANAPIELEIPGPHGESGSVELDI